MIQKKLIEQLKNYHENSTQNRHELIARSNEILRGSKKAIFSLHRGDLEEGEKLLQDVGSKISEIQKDEKFSHKAGVYRAGVEEYLEAMFYLNYLQGKTLDFVADLNVEFGEEYLSGLCDFTGELVRRSVLLASNREYEEIKKIRDICEEVVSSLIEFDLVAKLRAKYDDAKRNLKRVEGIIYDIEIRK